jgi:hypothetical protein
MKHLAIGLVALSAVSVGAMFASAQEQPTEASQTQVYIIQSGDTLWDLSSVMLNSPWYWPRLWHANPEIVNPHLIFPGQSLRMPGQAPGPVPAMAAASAEPALAEGTSAAARPIDEIVAAPAVQGQADYAEADSRVMPVAATSLAPEATPAFRRGRDEIIAVESGFPEPVPTSRLTTAIIPIPAAQRFYVRTGDDGFVSRNKVRAAASIVGAHNERSLFGQHDEVFISLGRGSGVEVGQRFTAFKTHEELSHPHTGEKVGFRTERLGELEVITISQDVSRARIIRSTGPLEKGTLLVPFVAYERRIFSQPADQKFSGVILTPSRDLVMAGEHSIVYIDRGARDGAEVGQVFEIFRPVADEVDVLTGNKLRIPPHVLGGGIIVETDSRTATALVWDSNHPIERGDRIRALRKRD